MRSHPSPRVVLAALAIVLAGALTACTSGGGQSSGTPVAGKTFTFAAASDPGSLDPQMTVLSEALAIDLYLYDSLIAVAPDGSVVPNLAQSWHATGRTATFTLRPGITCDDGSQLTASDVAANFNLIANPKNQSPMLGLLVLPGTKAAGNDATRTVTIVSRQPDSFLVTNLGTVLITCRAGLKDRAGLAKGKYGTGMYTMTSLVAGATYTLKLRKGYAWPPGTSTKLATGVPSEVVVKVIQNQTTAANLLLAGQINAAMITSADRKRLSARKLASIDSDEAIGQLWFNQAHDGPWSDPAVRTAMVQALKLNELSAIATSGHPLPPRGLVTSKPSVCSGDSVTGNLAPYDLSAAAAALDSAGWIKSSNGLRKKGGKTLSVRLVYETTDGQAMASAAELVQQSWRSLGADVKVRGLDAPGLNTALFTTGDWDVSMASFNFSLPNQMIPFVSGPSAPNGTNFAGIDNPTYNAAAAKATTEVGAASCPTWTAAQRALVKDVDVVPYADTATPMFAKNATFSLYYGWIVPSSIRMLSP